MNRRITREIDKSDKMQITLALPGKCRNFHRHREINLSWHLPQINTNYHVKGRIYGPNSKSLKLHTYGSGQLPTTLNPCRTPTTNETKSDVKLEFILFNLLRMQIPTYLF